jgi:hypothetical protein
MLFCRYHCYLPKQIEEEEEPQEEQKKAEEEEGEEEEHTKLITLMITLEKL